MRRPPHVSHRFIGYGSGCNVGGACLCLRESDWDPTWISVFLFDFPKKQHQKKARHTNHMSGLKQKTCPQDGLATSQSKATEKPWEVSLCPRKKVFRDPCRSVLRRGGRVWAAPRRIWRGGPTLRTPTATSCSCCRVR